MHCTEARKIERTRRIIASGSTESLELSRASWLKRCIEESPEWRICEDIVELIDAELAARVLL